MTVERPLLLEQATGGERPRMSSSGDAVTMLTALWLIGGLFVDGWAHNNLSNLETFFTPWHALFYSGFVATASWVAWSVWRHARLVRPWTSRSPDVWRAAVPVGYGYALAGVVLFGASGLGDLTWHTVFGIEQNIAALLSPTHLGLVAGAFLIVTAPVRSASADPTLGPWPGLRRLLPAVLSVTLAGCLIGFILQTWDPLIQAPAERGVTDALALEYGPNSPWVSDLQIQSGVAQYLLATLFLFGPLVYLAGRWRLPASTPLIVIGVHAVLVDLMDGLPAPELAALSVASAAVVGGLAAVLRPGPDRPVQTRVFAAAGPFTFWALHMLGIAVAGPGLGWAPEVWGGAVIWGTLVGVALTFVLPIRTVATGTLRPGVLPIRSLPTR